MNIAEKVRVNQDTFSMTVRAIEDLVSIYQNMFNVTMVFRDIE